MPFEPGNKLAKGRPKGVPNKVNGEIKDMIRQALDEAGGVSYLKQQALENSASFLTLVGKVIPAELNAKVDSKVIVEIRDFMSDEE